MSKNLNVLATEAGFIKQVSTLKAQHRGRLNDLKSGWPMMVTATAITMLGTAVIPAESGLLARYTPAVHDGPWLVAERRFDPVVLSRNVHVAVRGAPSIAPGQASIRVKEIAVTFSGRPVTFIDLIKGIKRVLKISR